MEKAGKRKPAYKIINKSGRGSGIIEGNGRGIIRAR